eukprot:TRINITY_DN886_c0_g1_i2.p1 TRINITY_DN886_c0_g1~~TRINITY_DN886_c0_g1_i2.p1  ORF type:complete len:1939 (-),score=196.57 TRINITY_DN886_c0_g1_i2:270-5654(-)
MVSDDRKKLWLLALPMLLHAGYAFANGMDQATINLGSWVIAQPVLTMIVFGCSSSVGVLPTYAAHVACVCILLGLGCSKANTFWETAGPMFVPLHNWEEPLFGLPFFNVAAALICCQLMRSQLECMSPMIGGLFFVGWGLQLVSIIIDSGVHPISLDPLVSLVCHSHLGEYLVGLSITPFQRDEPLLGAAIVALVLALFVAVDASHLECFSKHMEISGLASRRFAVWLITPVFAALVRALANPKDALGKLLRLVDPPGFVFPLSAWLLLPAMPTLMDRFGFVRDASFAGPMAGTLVVWIVGAIIDGLINFFLPADEADGDSSTILPRNLQKARFAAPNSQMVALSATALYYGSFVFTILFVFTFAIVSGRRAEIAEIHENANIFKSILKSCTCIAIPGVLCNIFSHMLFPATVRAAVPETALDEELANLDLVLFFRYCTRGNNPKLVEENVKNCSAVLEAAALPLLKNAAGRRSSARCRLQVVTDVSMDLASRLPSVAVDEVVVPNSYKCPGGAKFKARALHYAIRTGPEQKSTEVQPTDWVVHLDEETQFDVRCVWACYQHAAQQAREVLTGKKKYPNIGQGCIVYNTNGREPENFFTALCDCGRVADDFGKFRLCWESARPCFGMHGSFVVAQQGVEEAVGFDHGLRASITEDTYFALYAWDKIDLKFNWIDAFMFEQSPFSIDDLVKQRARWFQGIAYCCFCPKLPLRVKLVLMVLWFSWTGATLAMMGSLLIMYEGVGVGVGRTTGAWVLQTWQTLFVAFQMWHYMMGFCMSFNPRDLGVARWFLSQLAIILGGLFIGLVECCGIVRGLYLLASNREEFYIVQKEKAEKAPIKGEEATTAVHEVPRKEQPNLSVSADVKSGLESTDVRSQTTASIVRTDSGLSTNASVDSFVSEMSVQKMFFQSVERFPTCKALVCRDVPCSMTYVELSDSVLRLASHLRQLGLVPGSCVATLTERSPAFVVGVLGSIAFGGVAVAIEASWPECRQVESAKFMRALAIITDSRRILPAEITMHVVGLELTSGRLPSRIRADANTASVDGSDRSSFVIAFWSSGSTGKPKAIMYDHNSIVHGCTVYSERSGMEKSTRSLFQTPGVWSILEWQLLAPLFVGGAVILARPGGERNQKYIADMIRQEMVTVCNFVPSFLHVLLDEFEVEGAPTLRSVTSVGSALPMATVRRFHALFPKVALHNVYGLSETCACSWTTNCLPSTQFAPVGYPEPNASVVIVAADGVVVTQPGEVGQICFGGTLQRYWAQDEDGSSKFGTIEPFGLLFFSGDLGRWGPHGLECLGRIDRQVQINGIRVEPGEVEAVALESDAQVDYAACVTSQLEASGSLVLFVAPAHVDTKLLQNALDKRLPSYMLPVVFCLDTLPVLPNGKTDMTFLNSFAEQKTKEGAVTIRDSLGVTREVSHDTAKACKAVDCGFAFGIVAVILHHWFDCGEGLCKKTQSSPLYVQNFVRYILDADFLIFVFVVGGATIERKLEGKLPMFGRREVLCAVLFLLIGWPLYRIAAFFQPWSPGWKPMSTHRWYLAAFLSARSLLVLGKFVVTPGVLTVLLVVPIAIASSPFSLKVPVIKSCVAYAFGLVEASHVCDDPSRETFFSVYDRKFLVVTFLYVFFYHYGNDLAEKAKQWFREPLIALLGFLAVFCISLRVMPVLVAATNGDGPFLQVIVEMVVGCVMSGLLFACFARWQPAGLVWIGQRTAVAYVLHPYLLIREQPWDPIRVLPEATRYLPNSLVSTGLVELLLILAYPIAGVAITATIFNAIRFIVVFIANLFTFTQKLSRIRKTDM